MQYSVAVVATMSAGKSTLLNALMVEDLLPTNIMACTSTVFAIIDDDKAEKFMGRHISGCQISQWEDIDREKLIEWNEEHYDRIELKGNMPVLMTEDQQVQVTFLDTPGPNNSTNIQHSQITTNLIENHDYSCVVCVLNARALSTNNEAELLAELKVQLDERKNFNIFFALNQIDELDIEQQEYPYETIKELKDFLVKLGFNSPVVIPTSAKLSMNIRNIHTLQKALNSGDIIAIRAALIAIVDKDKNTSKAQATMFAEAVSAELATKNIQLFVEDNGRFKLPPEQEWTTETWHNIKAAMQTNFSKEKFILADQVRQKIFSTKPVGNIVSAPTRSTMPSSTKNNPSEGDSFTSRYSITAPLKAAIANKDVIAIRSALIALADKDYDASTPIARLVSLEVADYLKQYNIELFVADNGRLTLPPPAEWTKETWHGVKAAMQINFSKEKFILAEEIIKSLKDKTKTVLPARESNEKMEDVSNAVSDDDIYEDIITPQNPVGSNYRQPYTSRPTTGNGQRPHTHTGRPRPRPYRSNPHSSILITGGVLIIGGIVVGAIVAGVIGAVIGGGAGVAFSAKMLNDRK